MMANDTEEMDRMQDEMSRMQKWVGELEEKVKLLQGHNEASGLTVMKLESGMEAEREAWKSVKERVASIEGEGGKKWGTVISDENEPSPYCSKVTSVNDAYAPISAPFLNLFQTFKVDPSSPAKYFPQLI